MGRWPQKAEVGTLGHSPLNYDIYMKHSACSRGFVKTQLYSICCCFELELELIQTQMTQKPMLRAEVYARALRASQNRKEDSV